MTARRALPRIELLLLGLLTVAALALRLWDLGGRPLLSDESSSFYFSQLPLATLLGSLCDPHPPGYYLLLRGAAALGQSESWLRLPSALAGALAVPLTWAVARLAGAATLPRTARTAHWSGQAGLLAAALVAFAPLAVWYSQEVRAYALLSLLTLGMTWAGLRWRLRPTLPAALAFLVLGWLALWTEYGALVILAGLNLFLLSGWPWRPGAARPPGVTRRWLALQAALLAPFALWWLLSAQRLALSRMSYQAIFLAVQAQGLGLAWTPQQAGAMIRVIVLAAAALGLALALAVRQSGRVRRWLGSPWVAALLLALVMGLALLGALPRLYTIKRHLNALLPFVSMAAAWALLADRDAAGGLSLARRLAAGGVIALLLALSLAMPRLAPEPAWRAAVATLHEQWQPGDAIWVDELDAPVFAYYWGGARWEGWQPLRARDLAALEAAPEGQRVWLVGSITPYRDLRQTLPPGFAGQRFASQSFAWRDLALTAYDASAAPQPVIDPPLALRWGLDILSPLDVTCQP